MRGNFTDNPFDAVDEIAIGIDVRVALPAEIVNAICETTGMRQWEFISNQSHNVTVPLDGSGLGFDTLEPMTRYMVERAIREVARTVQNGSRNYRRNQATATEPSTDDDLAALVLDTDGDMVETPIGIAYGDGSDNDL